MPFATAIIYHKVWCQLGENEVQNEVRIIAHSYIYEIPNLSIRSEKSGTQYKNYKIKPANDTKHIKIINLIKYNLNVTLDLRKIINQKPTLNTN